MIHIIEIHQFAFYPPELRIKTGDEVRWHNFDNFRHSVRRDDYPIFDTGPIPSNTTSTEVRFNEVSPESGLGYYCEPHPQMTGIIVVEGATSKKPRDVLRKSGREAT